MRCLDPTERDLHGRVGRLRVEDNPRRETLTVVMTDRNGADHEARALSDGTLRFLALATMETDPEATGMLCLEEPENGMHPDRIPAMLRLLLDLATDPRKPVGLDNPLRQVVINTHSPGVEAQVPDDSLLGASLAPSLVNGRRTAVTTFEPLPDTWRAQADPEARTMPGGRLLAYPNPYDLGAGEEDEDTEWTRVIDRADLQPLLPFPPQTASK